MVNSIIILAYLQTCQLKRVNYQLSRKRGYMLDCHLKRVNNQIPFLQNRRVLSHKS